MGDFTPGSWAAGSNVGVVAADKDRDAPCGRGFGVREGLSSCWLFLRDLVAGVVGFEAVVLAGGRMGEDSLDANGEGPTELFADGGFEG